MFPPIRNMPITIWDCAAVRAVGHRCGRTADSRGDDFAVRAVQGTHPAQHCDHRAYFHNGVFLTLRQVIEWYVTRTSTTTPRTSESGRIRPGGNPYVAAGSFYLNSDGTPDLYEYNDLPALRRQCQRRRSAVHAPDFRRRPAPTLTSDEIDDVVAFLCTLTDGFDPANPTAYNLPAQCQGGASTGAAAHTRGTAP